MKSSISFSVLATAAVGCVLSSCVYRSNPVPEIPYKPRVQQPVAQPPALTQVPGAVAPATQQPLVPGYTAVLTPTPAQPATPTVRPAVTPTVRPAVTPTTRPAVTPTPTVRPTTPTVTPTGSHITQSYTPPAPAVTPAPAPAMQPPVVSTVTPPSTTGAANPPTDPKLITNTGPIPVATKVEGDPIRVYNPLDPTKTIRIIDPKTGKVHPSGKVLKVKGTNFKFIVP